MSVESGIVIYVKVTCPHLCAHRRMELLQTIEAKRDSNLSDYHINVCSATAISSFSIK
jgi:hypothetical protein